MATVQQLLDDINLLYRNSFTTNQKLVWMNEEQRELFEIIEIDSVPYSFSTVAGQSVYPVPVGVEIDKIKVITYQISDSQYAEVPFKENDNNQIVNPYSLWYTILENNFYLNISSGPVDDRLVYIYLDADPEEIVASMLNIEPSVPIRYQELLKLGVLKRIAKARKDVIMYNNYTNDYELKIADLAWKMKQFEPEWTSPLDVMPRAGGKWRRGAMGCTFT